MGTALTSQVVAAQRELTIGGGRDKCEVESSQNPNTMSGRAGKPFVLPNVIPARRGGRE